MIVRQLMTKSSPCFQGAIKIQEIQKREFQTNSFEIREFKKLQYKSVDPREVDEISQFLIEHINQNKEHFMGALTFGVLLYGEQIPFEPLIFNFQHFNLREIHELESIGTLQVEQKTWIPIDGLHRYYAILKTLRELPPYKRENFECEEIPIILIPCSSLDQLQDLMFRLQKSVRAVDRGEAIRIASNDRYAQLARKVCGIDRTEEWVIPEKLVNWKTNTLTNRLQKFTTLSVLYDSARILYPDLNTGAFSSKEFAVSYQEFAKIWKLLIERFQPFCKATHPETDKTQLRNEYICLKATGQLVIMQIIKLALQNEGQEAVEKTIKGLNRVSWEVNNPIWDNILLINGRLNSGDSARLLTAHLIAYHIGVKQSDKEIYELKMKYKRIKHDNLPSPLYS